MKTMKTLHFCWPFFLNMCTTTTAKNIRKERKKNYKCWWEPKISKIKRLLPNSTAFTVVLSENPTWKKHEKQTWMSLKHYVNLVACILTVVSQPTLNSQIYKVAVQFSKRWPGKIASIFITLRLSQASLYGTVVPSQLRGLNAQV